ncbi:MAG: glycosyltransferase family 4 protein [Thermodesulfobacteriota bacterium]
MKLKVLFINHSVRDGGPGRSLFYILKYIDRESIEPHILIPKDDLFSEDLKSEDLYSNVIIDCRFPENIQRPRVETKALNNLKNRCNLVSQLAKIISIIVNIIDIIFLIQNSSQILKKNGIDVIYCNGTIAKIVGAFMGKKNNTKVIWHVRNIQQTKFLSFVIKRLSKFKCVKKIICVSNAAAAQFDEVIDKVHVVYNGLDPSDFSKSGVKELLRSEYDIPPETIVIGNTGRVVKRKGYKDFINIAKQILDESDYENKVKFVIVGDTPYFFPINHLNELKEYAKKLGIEENFIFTGYKKDVKPYLKDFDIFVIPSNYPDPFPRSLIEAMSFSLPVIGFRIGGIAEAIEEGKSGFLCEKDGFSKMKNHIQTLINNEDLRKKMGRNARSRVLKMYSAEDRTKDIQEIILELS